MINLCSFEGCDKNAAINGNGRCRVHGGRTRCNDLGCSSFAKKGGKCGKHVVDRVTCSAKGCYKQPVKNGICIAHGAIRLCKIIGCELPLFSSGKCRFHFNNSMVTFPKGDVCTQIITLANINTPIVINRRLERDYHHVVHATELSGNCESVGKPEIDNSMGVESPNNNVIEGEENTLANVNTPIVVDPEVERDYHYVTDAIDINGNCIGIGNAEVYNSLGPVPPINNDIMGEVDFGSSTIEFDNYVDESSKVSVAMAMITLRNEPTSKTSDKMKTILDIPDLPLEIIQDYVGMNNWEHVIAFGAVCKTWRAASKHHLANVGVTHMEGGQSRKLCVMGFLDYLHQDKFRFAERIYVPCGKKTDKLFYSDVKLICPHMKELIHDKWIKVNGTIEYVLEGQSRHRCCRMYKHDYPSIPGVNAYIQYHWDKQLKVTLVSEGKFVQLYSNQVRTRRQTSFWRY